MIDVGTARFEAADCGSRVTACSARQREATLACRVHIHECAIHCLIDLVRPESTVEVHPFVYVEYQQSATGGVISADDNETENLLMRIDMEMQLTGLLRYKQGSLTFNSYIFIPRLHNIFMQPTTQARCKDMKRPNK